MVKLRGDAGFVRVLVVTRPGTADENVVERLDQSAGWLAVLAGTDPGRVVDRVAGEPIDCVVPVVASDEDLSVVESVRERWSALPVVAYCTGGADPTPAVVQKSGVTDYVAGDEPEPVARLRERLGAAVERHRLTAESRDGDESIARTALDALDVAACRCRADGTVDVATEAMGDLLDVSASDFRDQPFWDHLPADAGVRADVQSIERGEWLRTEIELEDRANDGRQADGGDGNELGTEAGFETVPDRELPTTVELSVVRLPLGDPADEGDEGGGTLVVTARDVTERARYRPESQKMRAFLDNAPVFIYAKDGEGTHIRVSREFENSEETLGQTDLELYEEEEARDYYEDDMRVIEGDEEVINRLEENPEHNRFYLATKVPWTDENGEIQGLVGLTRDVTTEKRHEQQLRNQNERLRTVARVISDNLRDALDRTLESLEATPEDDEHLADAVDALERTGDLITDLLMLVRHGQWVDETETAQMAGITRECWSHVVDRDGTLAFDSSFAVEADPDRLRQLLENLFRNAVVHGGEGVTVTVGQTDGGFYVADDGPGIPEDRREAVFEPGHTTSEDGTGFGLMIVELVAEAHGWDVRIAESDEGGARFEFSGVETSALRSPEV